MVDLPRITMNSPSFDITEVMTNYLVSEYIFAILGIGKGDDSDDDLARTKKDALLYAHMIRTFVDKAYMAGMCSKGTVIDSIERVKKALKIRWDIEW